MGGAYIVSRATGQRLKEQSLHKKELCKHMEREIIGMEKKLFICTVWSLIVVNYVAIEIGFPCISTT